MKSILRFALVWCGVLVLSAGVAVAQQAPPAHAPQIHATLNSTNDLMEDLKSLFNLAGPAGARNWKAFEEFLVITFDGTDPQRPFVIDILINPNGSDVRAHFPLLVQPNKPQGQRLLVNLNGVGIPSKRLSAGLYELGGGAVAKQGAAFNGFLRLLAAPINYGSISTDRALLPANLPDPTRGPIVAALLAKKYDVGFLMKNAKQAENDQKARRTDFQKAKENLLAGLKKKPEQTDESFAVQKSLLEHNLSELERFIAESDELLLGWITDAPKKEARLDFELAAIPGSSLDTSAKLLGQTPGMFSGVPRSENAILSGRLHFPLDQLRQSNLIGALPLFRASADARIKASTRPDEQKTALTEVSKRWFEMVEDQTKVGVIDGMIEVSQAKDEKANLLAAFQAKDGQAFKGIVELLPQVNPDYKVTLDADKVGDYSIHSVQVPEKDEDFAWLFGKGAPVFVATGPKAWWIAIGPKSLEQLKAATEAAGKENAEAKNNFLTLFYHVGPWIKFLDAHRARVDAMPSDKKLTEAELKDKKDRATHRKLAIDTFESGKDTIETKIDANNGRVTGSTRFDEGILKFIGAELAKFSEETLK